jgi:SAM-dependent methyltransferase
MMRSSLLHEDNVPASKPKARPRLAQDPEPEPSEVAHLRLEPVLCCICGHEDAAPIGVGEDFEYRTSNDTYLAVCCRECGLVYLRLRPAASELPRIYPPTYHAFDFSPERFGLPFLVRRRLEARRLLRWCRGLGADARILDVGCGDGFHLALSRDYGMPGWRLEGVDASPRAVAAARARGLTVHEGTIQEVELPKADYDLILLIATVEHVEDPPGLLRSVQALLRPGGRVVIVTDNTDSPSFRLLGKRYWGGYHFPRHWNLFNGHTIRCLAEAADLDVVQVTTSVTPVNWMYTLHNALVDWHAPNWLINRFTLRSPVALAVFTMLDLGYQVRGRGGLIEAILRRPWQTQSHPRNGTHAA